MPIETTGSGLDIEFEIGDSLDTTKDEPVKVIEPAAAIVDDPVEVVKPDDTIVIKNDPIPDPVQDPVDNGTDDSLVGEVISKFGYDFEEEFEDSTEGLVKATKAISEKLADETLDAIFSAHPTVKAHLDFVRNGGDPNAFFGKSTETDYSKIELTADKVDAQKDVIRTYLKEKGNDDAFIDDMLEAYQDKNVLLDKALAAKNALVATQEIKRNEMLEGQRAKADADRKEAEKTWNAVRETVTKAPDLSGIPIVEKDRNAFMTYISAPVTKDGRTQRDLDAAELKIEQQLAIDYLLFKKLDMKGFIQTKAKTTAAASLRDRLTADKRAKGNTAHSSSSGNISEDVDTDNLL
jgi:hypothetical protein